MAKRCGCKVHDDVVGRNEGKTFALNKLTSRKYPQNIIDQLVQCGVLSPRGTYLCSLCVEDQYREQGVRQALDNHSVQETMEHVYYMQNERLMDPSAFGKTLMVYFASRSKFAVNVLSKNGPYASYRTFTNWIEEQGSVPLAAPETDVITFYDNNQIIGKTHHISINNKCQTSTITTGIHISTEGPQIQHVK